MDKQVTIRNTGIFIKSFPTNLMIDNNNNHLFGDNSLRHFIKPFVPK